MKIPTVFVWQIETPEPEGCPVYNDGGTEIFCYTVEPTVDQTQAAVSATLGVKEDEIEVQIVSTVEQMRHDLAWAGR